jgi:hypothetical protein
MFSPFCLLYPFKGDTEIQPNTRCISVSTWSGHSSKHYLKGKKLRYQNWFN